MNESRFLLKFNKFSSNGIFFDNERFFLLAKKNKVYSYDKLSKKFIKKGSVNISWFDKLFGYFRIYQRLRRLVFYNIIPLGKNSFFLNFSNKIGYISENGNFNLISGIVNKSKILNNGLATNKDYIFFGEYFPNNERKKTVNIYKFSKSNFRNEKVFTFPAGKVRHIHGIYKDPYSNDFYVLTGDKANECGIYVTSDEFKTLKLMGGGDETWRAVSLVFTKDYFYYGTDAEFIPNKVYSISRDDFSRDEVGNLSGPVYYSALYKKIPLFFITAEMCPSQQDDFFKIVGIENGRLKTKYKCAKDFNFFKSFTKIFGMIFMPGTMHLPFHNDMNIENLYLYGIGLKDADDKVFKLN